MFGPGVNITIITTVRVISFLLLQRSSMSHITRSGSLRLDPHRCPTLIRVCCFVALCESTADSSWPWHAYYTSSNNTRIQSKTSPAVKWARIYNSRNAERLLSAVTGRFRATLCLFHIARAMGRVQKLPS